MQPKYTADDLARKILHDADLGPHVPPDYIRTALARNPTLAQIVEAAYRLGCEDADAQDEIYQAGYDRGLLDGERRAYAESAEDGSVYTEEDVDAAHRRGMEAGRVLAEADLLNKIRALVSAENDRVAADEYRRGRAEADSEHYAVGYARGYEDGKDDATGSVLVPEEVSK